MNINSLKVVGRIDAVKIDAETNTVYIVDWKSNSGMEDIEQLKLYCLAMQEMHPFESFNFACYFYFLEPDYYKSFYFDNDDITKYKKKLIKIIDEIKAEKDWKATPCDLCKYCEHSLECPEVKKYDLMQIENNEQAVELANRVLAFESAIKQAKSMLKDWALSHGDIITGDKKYTIVHTETFKSVKLTKAEKEYYERLKTKQTSEKETNGSTEPAGCDDTNVLPGTDRADRKEVSAESPKQYQTRWKNEKGYIYIIQDKVGDYTAVDAELHKLRNIEPKASIEEQEMNLNILLTKRRNYTYEDDERRGNDSEIKQHGNENKKLRDDIANDSEQEPKELGTGREEQRGGNSTGTLSIDNMPNPEVCVYCKENPCVCNETADFSYMGKVKRMWCEDLGKSKEEFESFKKNIAKQYHKDKTSNYVYKTIEDYCNKLIVLGAKKNDKN